MAVSDVTTVYGQFTIDSTGRIDWMRRHLYVDTPVELVKTYVGIYESRMRSWKLTLCTPGTDRYLSELAGPIHSDVTEFHIGCVVTPSTPQLQDLWLLKIVASEIDKIKSSTGYVEEVLQRFPIGRPKR